MIAKLSSGLVWWTLVVSPVLSGVVALPVSAQSTASADAAANLPQTANAGQRVQAVRAMVRQAVSEQNIPGYAIAIIQNGAVVYSDTIGMADIKQGKPVDQDTVFGLASVTKTFTALALLHLIDEGKIKPADRLDKYLKNLPDSWKKMTIVQLASMRAGLPESRNGEVAWPVEMTYLESQPLAYEPDTKHVYSNPSYRVLGSVIEAVTGMTYLDYVQKTILSPLHMGSTGSAESLASTGHVALQYLGPPNGPIRKIEPKHSSINFAAGMLMSSLHDMSLYAEALLDQKILTPAGYQTYWLDRPALVGGEPCPWAYGWGSKINPKLNQRMIAMNGGLPGVASTIILLPDSKTAIVALSNLRRKPVYTIARRAMTIFMGVEDSIPAEVDEPGQGN